MKKPMELVVVYHITTRENLPMLLKEGIKPSDVGELSYLSDTIKDALDWRDILNESTSCEEGREDWQLVTAVIEDYKLHYRETPKGNVAEITTRYTIPPDDIIAYDNASNYTRLKPVQKKNPCPYYYYKPNPTPPASKWQLLKIAKEEDELLIALDELKREGIEHFVRKIDKKQWQIFVKFRGRGREEAVEDMMDSVMDTIMEAFSDLLDRNKWVLYGTYDSAIDHDNELVKLLNKGIHCYTEFEGGKWKLYVMKNLEE